MTTLEKRTQPTRDMRYRYCIIYRAVEKAAVKSKEKNSPLKAQNSKFFQGAKLKSLNFKEKRFTKSGRHGLTDEYAAAEGSRPAGRQ